MHSNKITIAIPVYERTTYFDEALKSALNQTVKCNILVVDNASSHNYFETRVIGLKNRNIKYHRNATNIGMTNNWNKCLELSETEYITILNDDDVLHHQFVEKLLPLIENKKIVVCSNSIIGTAVPQCFNSEIVKGIKLKRFSKTKFLFGNLTPSVGGIYPTSIAKEIGGYKNDFYPAQDYYFWIEIATKIPIFKTSENLSFYRISDNQASNDLYYEIINQTYKIRQKIDSYKIFKYLTNYNLYLLFKFYSKNQNNISTNKLQPELSILFNTYEQKERNSLMKKATRIFYINILRILKVFKII